MIDSRTLSILRRVADEVGEPIPSSLKSVRERHAALMASNGPGPQMNEVENHTIGKVSLRVFCPTGYPLTVLVYFHGGGWVAGSLESTETVARKLAERSGCAVVVPEYRLAPEHPFPAAVDDAVAALDWAGANLSRIAGDAAPPLIVAGEGAGGTLAAVATLRATAAGEPRVGLQILVTPILDCAASNASVDGLEHGLLTAQLLDFCIEQYLPRIADRVDPDASPVRAPRVDGLPATVILCAEDELPSGATAQYAERLREAGAQVQLQRYRGLVHGAFGVLRVPIGEKPVQGFVRAARAYVARPDHLLPLGADAGALI